MNDTTFQTGTRQGSLPLNETAEAMIAATTRWSRFLGILTLSMAGIMFVIGATILFSASALVDFADFAGMNLLAVGITYMVCPIIYLFPGLYLCRYATHMRDALANRDEAALAEGLRQHKKLLKFIGILCIIAIAFILLFIIIGAIAGFAMLK